MTDLAAEPGLGSAYAHLSYSRADLMAAMRDGYDELIDFVTTPEFVALMDELGTVAATDRPRFVLSQILDRDVLERRGIRVPEDVMIQRSAFGDRRPTLFCVKKWLPDRFSDVWENVNLTFDNEYVDESVSRGSETAWRPPLPVDLQAAMMAKGIELNESPAAG